MLLKYTEVVLTYSKQLKKEEPGFTKYLGTKVNRVFTSDCKKNAPVAVTDNVPS